MFSHTFFCAVKNGIVVKVTKQITVKPVYLVYRYTVIGYKPHLLDRYTLKGYK